MEGLHGAPGEALVSVVINTLKLFTSFSSSSPSAPSFHLFSLALVLGVRRKATCSG